MSFFEKINGWAKNSVGLKLLTIGIIVLLLLIPSSMLDSLVFERQHLRDGAISEVSDKWGNQQMITGPIITIPYKLVTINDKKQKEESIAYAHFLPDSLSISGVLKPEKRYRGIYVVVLYNTMLHLNAQFGHLNIKALGINPNDLLLDQAFVSLGISDLKGVKDKIELKINDNNKTNFGPGVPVKDLIQSGVSTQIPVIIDGKISLSCNLNLNGSKRISFVPIGKETNVALTSSWESPSFEGAFLPEKRMINEKGFTAQWRVLELNRNFAQQGLGSYVAFDEMIDSENNYSNYDAVSSSDGSTVNVSQSTFGVKLLLPIDEYKKTLRSSKYSTMFILLTFLVVFFSEIFQKKKVHPIQYLLTGSAICLFYVLLLSLSEHLSFNYSYLISCAIILLLIGFYAHSIFRHTKITSFIVGSLVILYGFFYSLLQLEDYALLMGSAGLLLVLAVIMYITRNVDWYNPGGESVEKNT
jgi:inner membrane protein